jgi:hypothetical protein
MPGIGTNSLGSKFRTGTNCLGNFGRLEHLAAGPSSLIHRFRISFPDDIMHSTNDCVLTVFLRFYQPITVFHIVH